MGIREAREILEKFKYHQMMSMTEANARLWWLAKSTLRDAVGQGQIHRRQVPEGVEV